MTRDGITCEVLVAVVAGKSAAYVAFWLDVIVFTRRLEKYFLGTKHF